MRLAVAAALGGALVGWLDNLPAQAQPRPEQKKQLFVDAVIASVNDTPILQSRLFATSEGTIRGIEARSGRSLTLQEIYQQTWIDLGALISDYQMAQSARSFATIPVERFDDFLANELERDRQERVRELGSYGEFSKELERTGLTWPTYRASRELEKLKIYAKQFAVYERLRKQSNLYLTPRMLRDTYERFRERFTFPTSAKVAMVTFTGDDAQAGAERAAEFWRTGDWSARDVAERHPGATPLLQMKAASLPKPLREFALKGPLGNVSAPLPHAGGYAVVKVMEFRPGSDGKFEDPQVQAAVRRIAEARVIFEFEQDALALARERTEVWVYQHGRRMPPPR